ncbi:hypothetical protein EYS09_22205 [Streptomyces kasugaensis]|uniref:Uncharacterized protein n=1 Tax=Streptomyces kasugaensis TaxID=1946 RepID=A0A4Q9HRF2_STRKA|nr:hypothetical protein [Streptomyces kasugaensis]TBO57527.1 hypothetical protein EYS09_22205 [Streptomyces kasugaensis]
MATKPILGSPSLSVLTIRPRRRIAQRHLNAAAHVNHDVLYTTISAGMILIRRYLVDRGATPEFADRYGSAFGRVAAKTYRTTHDAEPRKAWSNSTGRWRRVMGYLPDDTDVLNTALAAYPRTARLTPEPADHTRPTAEADHQKTTLDYVHAPSGAEFVVMDAGRYETRIARDVRQLVMTDGRIWHAGPCAITERQTAAVSG